MPSNASGLRRRIAAASGLLVVCNLPALVSGQSLDRTVLRAESTKDIEVTLGARPDESPAADTAPPAEDQGENPDQPELPPGAR